MEVKEITAEETLPLRQAVLRNEKPLAECVFEGDVRETTFHFGVFEEGKLLGIVSLMANKNPGFRAENQYQLRGMAVLPEGRSRGMAKLLLESAKKRLKREGVDLIWCNARKNALGFYAKNGFSVMGEAFEIPEIGTHFLMFKNLET